VISKSDCIFLNHWSPIAYEGVPSNRSAILAIFLSRCELYCMSRKWEKRTAKIQSLITDLPYHVNDSRASAWLWSLKRDTIQRDYCPIVGESRPRDTDSLLSFVITRKGNRRNEEHRVYISRYHRISVSRSIRQVSRRERRDEQETFSAFPLFLASRFLSLILYTWILQYQMQHYAGLFFQSTNSNHLEIHKPHIAFGKSSSDACACARLSSALHFSRSAISAEL